MRTTGANISEKAKVWRWPGMELLKAGYRRQHFSRHYHRRFALGVIESGGLAFNYLGAQHLAAPGEINLCLPGESHDGHAAGPDGWRYRMFYLERDLVSQAAGEAAGRSPQLPYFKTGVISDAPLAREILSLHRDLEHWGLSELERQSRLLGILAALVRRHQQDRPVQPTAAMDQKAVETARQIINDQPAQNISLEELSRAACLSRFHLLRCFKRQTGLPPHAYQNLVRIRKARDLIAAGRSLAQAALEMGFADQSHMSRVFKKTYGITPGQFSKSLQDPK